MPKEDFSENILIEQPAIALFGELMWETADCFHEFEQAGGSPLGRETAAEVVLVRRKKQQARAAVRQLIEEMLDRLPPAYTPGVYEQTCEQAYLHVYDCYYSEGKSIYSIPASR